MVGELFYRACIYWILGIKGRINKTNIYAEVFFLDNYAKFKPKKKTVVVGVKKDNLILLP